MPSNHDRSAEKPTEAAHYRLQHKAWPKDRALK